MIKSLAPHNTTASISSTASVAMHETASESKYFSADPNPTAVEDSDDDLMEMAPSVVDHQNTRKRAMQDIVNDHNGNDQVNDNEDDQLRMNKKVALEVTGEKKPSPVKYASPVKKQPSVSPTTLTKTTTPSFEQQQKNGTKDQQGNDIVTDEATDKKRKYVVLQDELSCFVLLTTFDSPPTVITPLI